MIKSLVALVAFLAAPGLAHAGDSTWLLCKGTATLGSAADARQIHLVASLLEHRGSDGATRDLAVTLVYGDHASRGEIVGSKAGDWLGKPTAVKVSSLTGKKRLVFSGTAQLSEAMTSVALTGTFDLTFGADPKAPRMPLVATLSCETLDDLAIGH